MAAEIKSRFTPRWAKSSSEAISEGTEHKKHKRHKKEKEILCLLCFLCSVPCFFWLLLCPSYNRHSQQLGIQVTLRSFLHFVGRHILDEPAVIAGALYSLAAINCARILQKPA